MIHTSLGKSKKRKPTAKQRELDASWGKVDEEVRTKEATEGCEANQ